MRLMLGFPGNPTLLVSDVDPEKYAGMDFDFKVMNGGWRGNFNHGTVVVMNAPIWMQNEPTHGVQILCTDQDRLRGNDWFDYQTVFSNFHDETYKGYKPKPVELPEDWDDDIPF